MSTDPGRWSEKPMPFTGVSDTVEHVFATPIVSRTFHGIDAMNERLRRLILDLEATTRATSKSNQGGWQSPPDLFAMTDPAIASLEAMIAPVLNAANAQIGISAAWSFEFELFGWAAVNRHGHYNVVHLHPEATWSGVYYVDAGDEPADGPAALLEFIHPSPAALMSFFPGILPSARTVRPRTGMMILFPSYLQHGVRMYHGQRPRICVAFNAHLRSARKVEEGERPSGG